MSNLKAWRQRRGMSQAQLAKASGVSIRMIQYYEQGKNDINRAEALSVYKLAQALVCSMETLLELDDALEASQRL